MARAVDGMEEDMGSATTIRAWIRRTLHPLLFKQQTRIITNVCSYTKAMFGFKKMQEKRNPIRDSMGRRCWRAWALQYQATVSASKHQEAQEHQ